MEQCRSNQLELTMFKAIRTSAAAIDAMVNAMDSMLNQPKSTVEDWELEDARLACQYRIPAYMRLRTQEQRAAIEAALQ